VTSDGCLFQQKAFGWFDSASLQNSDAAFSQLLFVPCIRHWLQNAIVCLSQASESCRDLITSARDAAVVLRKRECRATFGAVCPMYCATRWIHDYLILGFIFDHLNNVHMFFADRGHRRPNQMIALLPLLEQVFSTVRHFEFDRTSLAIVYPGVQELITLLKKKGDKIRSRKLTTIYQDCAVMIRKRTLDTTNYIS
jgi:hypothetical protein